MNGLQRYNDVWQRLMTQSRSVNFGIGGDKVENILDRIIYGEYPASVKNVFIQAGTNNLQTQSTAGEISRAIVETASSCRTRFPEASITIIGLLPRQHPNDGRWVLPKVREVNSILKGTLQDYNFIDIYKHFEGHGPLDWRLFIYDGLHLNECGNRVLIDIMIDVLRSLSQPHPTLGSFVDDFAIGETEFLGTLWDSPYQVSPAPIIPTDHHHQSFPPLPTPEPPTWHHHVKAGSSGCLRFANHVACKRTGRTTNAQPVLRVGPVPSIVPGTHKLSVPPKLRGSGTVSVPRAMMATAPTIGSALSELMLPGPGRPEP